MEKRGFLLRSPETGFNSGRHQKPPQTRGGGLLAPAQRRRRGSGSPYARSDTHIWISGPEARAHLRARSEEPAANIVRRFVTKSIPTLGEGLKASSNFG